MKKLFVSLAAVLLLAACAEEPGIGKKTAVEIAGEYAGLMSMSVSGTLTSETELQIKLTPEGDETVTMTVPAMPGMGAMMLPSFDITGVNVSFADDGSCVISKESFEAVLEDMTITVSELSGTIYQDKNAKIAFELKPGAMPFAIACTFDTKAEPTLPQSTVYDGLLSLEVGGNVVGEPVAIDLTVDYYESEGTATLKFPAFGVAPMAVSAFELEGVKATKSDDGSIALALNEKTVEGEVPLKISNLTGTLNGSDAIVEFGLQPGAMPFAIACKFTTQK